MATLQTPPTDQGVIPPSTDRDRNPQLMPRLPAYPPFYYQAHPNKWTVLEGMLVPELAKLIAQPGVSRVDPDGDTVEAQGNRRNRGWTIIPRGVDGPIDPSDPTKLKSYMRAHRVIPRGKTDPEYVPTQFAHLDQFARVFPGARHIRPGGKPYAEWCASLVTRGIVAPAASHVIERLIEDRHRLLGEYEPRVDRQPALKGTIEQIEGELKVLAAELKKAEKREAKKAEKREAKGAE